MGTKACQWAQGRGSDHKDVVVTIRHVDRQADASSSPQAKKISGSTVKLGKRAAGENVLKKGWVIIK